MFTIPAKLVLIWNLAQALGLDTARWKQGTKLETTKSLSWAEMFGRAGHVLPFSLPSTKPSTTVPVQC